jgi:hypothetical protein
MGKNVFLMENIHGWKTSEVTQHVQMTKATGISHINTTDTLE